MHAFLNVFPANVTSARQAETFPGEFPGKCDVSVAGGPLLYAGEHSRANQTPLPCTANHSTRSNRFLGKIIGKRFLPGAAVARHSLIYIARYFLSNRTKVKCYQKAKTIFLPTCCPQD